MDRRDFLRISSTGLLGLAAGGRFSSAEAEPKRKRKGSSYSVVILGDTHYDMDPESRYHTGYSDKSAEREQRHRAEGEKYRVMWQDKEPRLIKRAACLMDDNTRMAFQLGDIIQGDTGSGEVHRQMLDDAYTRIKAAFAPLPVITVTGNHDIRSYDDKVSYKVYKDYMREKMSQELGRELAKTTFLFNIEEDAYMFVDFNKPDDEEIEKLLKESKGARNLFVVGHLPVFPFDASSGNWILHGRDGKDDLRRHYREEFAKRNAIVLCGHTHTTEFADWYGDGGRITQMTMNSVWVRDSAGVYKINAQGPEEYGLLSRKAAEKSGTTVPENMTALFDEYRPGLKEYSHSPAAGCYKMNVSPEGVTIDFYAGDDTRPSAKFTLR